MKNALFVGSFNPVTKAHLAIASDLLQSKLIDVIYFLPVNSNKIDLIKIDKRLDMLKLVIKKNMQTLDIYNYDEQGKFNYYVLENIALKIPISSLIMGSDLFLKFKTFQEYEKIIQKYQLIIIKRNNLDITKYLEEFKDYQDRIIIIDKKYLGSSTEARNSLNKKNNKYLAKKVLDYIKKYDLYN